VLSKLATTAVDLATAIILVRLLPKQDFAVLSILLVIYELSRQVCLMGYPDSVLYFAEELGERCHRALALQTIKTVLKFTAVAAVVMVGMSFTVRYWLPNWDVDNVNTVSEMIPLLAASALMEFPTWPTTQILISRRREKWAGIYESSTSALLLLAMLVPILLGMPVETLIYAVLGYSAVRLVASFILLILSLPSERGALPEDFAHSQRSYAIPLGLQSFVGPANRYIDRFVIGFFLVEGALAHYQVAAQEVPFIKAFPMGFAGVMVPLYARLFMNDKRELALELWRRSVRVVSPLAIGVGVYLFIEAPVLIEGIFGPEYLPAVWPFRIFTIAVFNRWAHYGSIAQGAKDTGSLFRLTTITLLINVVLNFPLTYFFGITGAAAATLIAGLSGWWMFLRLNSHHLRTTIGGVIDWGHIGRLTLASAIAGAAIFGMVELLDLRTGTLLLDATIFAAIYFPAYCLIAYLFHGFDTDHYRGLLYILRRVDRADRIDK
jgi:O-antigen/teichoic acid export membrane protein